MPLTQGHDPTEAFLFDRPHEALRMRVAVGGGGCSNHSDARRGEQILHPTAPLRIAIANQDPTVAEDIIHLAGPPPPRLEHKGFIRVRRRSEHAHAARVQLDEDIPESRVRQFRRRQMFIYVKY
jgi:hypothetical protein